MAEGDGLQELVVFAYDSATGAAPWNTFLEAVATRVSATTVALFSQVPGDSDSAFLGSHGLAQTAMRQYREHFSTRNILMSLGERLHVPGVVRTSETICSREALLKSEYYNDYMCLHDVRYSMALTPVRNAGQALHLSVFRPRQARPFGAMEMQTFFVLSEHLRRALQVYLQLSEKEERTRLLEDVVARVGKGVAFLDRRGKVVYVNAVLERIIGGRDGLAFVRGHLEPSSPGEARTLRALVDEATRGGTGGSIAISRPSGKPSFSVLVSPILRRVHCLGSSSQPAVLITVADPASSCDANVIALQQTYHLTRAEARVASRLASGATLNDVADQLSISIHTARTHLKRVLAKTGARRQSELMRRLLLA